MRHCAAILCFGVCGASLTSSALADDLLIRGASIVAPDGTITPGHAVVIRGEKIDRVGDADSMNALDTHAYPGAVISPGLIDAYSRVGTRLGRDERFRPIDPGLSIIDGLDPHDPSLARALRAGITSVVATPGENLIVGGAAAVVRTFVDGPGLDVIRADGPIAMSLGEAVFDLQLEPTSRAGAVAMLRQALTEARLGRGDPRLEAVMAGRMPTIIRCEQAVDVGAAMTLFMGPTRPISLVHSADLLAVAEDLEGSGVSIIAGPYSLATSADILMGPAAISAKGMPVAFGTGPGPLEPEALRLSAALAVRYGLDAGAARRGLTSAAATTAGVEARIGSLAKGLDADIVVFSADPLRLDARVIAVYVRGKKVYADVPPIDDRIEHAWEGAGL